MRKYFGNSNNDPAITSEPVSGDFDSVENKIFFSSTIDEISVLKLNKTIITTANKLLHQSIVTDNNVANIQLYINSMGGEIFSGLSAMDEILNCKVPVITIADGGCASAATFLLVVGKKRLIKKHSFVLIHQLRSGHWGTYSQFVDEAKNLDLLMTTIKGIYKEYTKIPMKKLDELLQHDLWLDAKTAQEYGLIDEIL